MSAKNAGGESSQRSRYSSLEWSEKVVIVEPNTCTYECFFFLLFVCDFFFFFFVIKSVRILSKSFNICISHTKSSVKNSGKDKRKWQTKWNYQISKDRMCVTRYAYLYRLKKNSKMQTVISNK